MRRNENDVIRLRSVVWAKGLRKRMNSENYVSKWRSRVSSVSELYDEVIGYSEYGSELYE